MENVQLTFCNFSCLMASVGGVCELEGRGHWTQRIQKVPANHISQMIVTHVLHHDSLPHLCSSYSVVDLMFLFKGENFVLFAETLFALKRFF